MRFIQITGHLLDSVKRYLCHHTVESGSREPRLPVELKSADPYIATGGFEWSLDTSLYNLVEAHSKEPFKRDAEVYDVPDEADPTELTCVTTWYGRQEEPEWEIVNRSSIET